NDQMALGAMGAIYLTGRKVPEDIAIVGFDNTPESAYFWPPLTTVHPRMVDVGRVAVQVLHQLITTRREGSNSVVPTATVLQPEFLIRQSSLTVQPLFETVAVH
ncbi:MAG TPA: substrate-binding domain-containing protein, partial [Anaerolineae bacterium]